MTITADRSPDVADVIKPEPDRCGPQTVLIVDDNELVQVGLRALLAAQPWVASCLEADSVRTARDVARRRQPQLVLVSAAVNGESGLALCRELHAALPMAKIVIMSGQGRVARTRACANGAVGFVSLGMPAKVIVDVVQRVAEGARMFPREQIAKPNGLLSSRELDVLHHLVAGLSNPEVAAALNLSRHTVKQHTSTVYRKLGVRNRVQAASRARELGLVA